MLRVRSFESNVYEQLFNENKKFKVKFINF